MMNYITYAKNLLAFALVGCVLFGAVFGFWWKGEILEIIRATGAILFVIIATIFFKNILRQSPSTN